MNRKQWNLVQSAIVMDDPVAAEEACQKAGVALLAARSLFEESALQVAYEQGAETCVAVWLGLSWDWSHRDFRGRTLLAYAIRAGTENWKEVLLKSGWPEKEHGDWEEIHEAFFAQENETLALEGLNQGWDPLNWVGAHGQTAFHLAAEMNWSAWLDEYLKLSPNEACWTSVNYWKNTPLMAGCRAGSEAAVKTLLAHCPEDSLKFSARVNANNRSAVEMAIWNQQFELVDALLKAFKLTATTTLSYWKKTTPIMAWNVAVATKTKQGLEWALKQRVWPQKGWPWQKSLALWVDDPAELERIRKVYPRRKWGAFWQEERPEWLAAMPETCSAAYWALKHGTWASCQWWRAQKSPWVVSPFSRLKSTKKERKEKLLGLLACAKETWVRSQKQKGIKGDLEELAPLLSPEELSLLSSQVDWTTEEWTVGWGIALSEGSVKQSRWFSDRLPAKARALAKSECASGANDLWFNVFKGLTKEKLEMMGEDAPWGLWGSGFKQPEMQRLKTKDVANMWIKHARTHPTAAKEWLKKAGPLPNELSLEILENGLKYRSPGTTSFMEQVLLQTQFFQAPKHRFKKEMPPWHGWIAQGKTELLEHYAKKGWFDKDHAVNRVKNGWCNGGLRHPKQAKSAWGLWALKGTKKTPKPSHALGEWLFEQTLFKWDYLKTNARRERTSFELEHWRWMLNRREIWDLNGRPARPLEVLWSGPGFLGSAQIHTRLVKTFGASIWEKTEQGESLGKFWLGKIHDLNPSQVKILESEKEQVETAWSEPPSAAHPWAKMLLNLFQNSRMGMVRKEKPYWETLAQTLRNEEQWGDVQEVVQPLIQHIHAYQEWGGGPRAGEETLVNRLIKAWSPQLAKTSVEGIPAWFLFGSAWPKFREKLWKTLEPHGVDWNALDKNGNDFIHYACSISEKALGSQYRRGAYHREVDPEEVEMSTLFAGNEVWELWLSLGGRAPFDPPEQSLAVRLSKWGQWRKWWEHRQLNEKHAKIIAVGIHDSGAL